MLSKRQRPKVDDYTDEGYLFGVLHFPVYDKAIQRLNAAELDVFVGPDYLVTLPAVELLPVTRLFRRCEDDESFREQLFSKGSGRLLYEVLDDLFDYCFPILDKIGHKLDSLEDDVFEGRSDEVVRDISNVKQEIISYRKIIKPERSTLRLLERHVERFLPEELELYFDDIVDASERVWDILDNYKEVVEALEQTNESVISHRQNDVLRILTTFSVVLLPLTLITGLLRHERALPRLRERRGRSGRSSPGCAWRSSACSCSSAGSAGCERATRLTARRGGSRSPWRTIVDWIASRRGRGRVRPRVRGQVAKPFRIPSSSMEPTLHCAKPGPCCLGSINDRVIANRLAYRFGDAAAGADRRLPGARRGRPVRLGERRVDLRQAAGRHARRSRMQRGELRLRRRTPAA